MCVRNETAAGDGRPTIIDAALARELPFLPPEEADAEIRRLTRQVGDLEEKNGALNFRNGHLEAVIKTLCRNYCSLRDNGYCDRHCPGRDYCDTGGLLALNLTVGETPALPAQEEQGG